MKGMELFSPSPKSHIPLFSSSPNPNSTKFSFNLLIRTLPSPSSSSFKISPFSSSSSSESAPILQEKLPNDDDQPQLLDNDQGISYEEALALLRRPVMELSGDDGGGENLNDVEEADTVSSSSSSSSVIDVGLSKFAKKMPIFEPQRVEFRSKEKPLGVNLELALYRAKVLGRKYRFNEAKLLLDKCLALWPDDGRLYVALCKILIKQSKTMEARAVYERGCQATQGENPYIWQCWAVLENKMGNIRRARELFDAATVADKNHVAAWHGWAVLELKQGNLKKARNLLGKALKYCGGNEYVYQTLALLEAKANRIERARYLFQQATKCNPKSCASWLAWAQLEMQLENNLAAKQLFEKAVQASPKNRFAWHVWGVFEASLGNVDKARKLLKIGHALNPRDPVLLQSLALLEYRESTPNLARALFRRASELDPRHQPVWNAWGWMEWKEGNIDTARRLYERALSIDSTSECAARCLQAWAVLEHRIGNLSAARRLFRSSLNINSQSYITWMTWAEMEEEEGNFVRAEEIRNLYFQQRTEVVDDASWVTGFLDVIDPTLDSIKKLLKFGQNTYSKGYDDLSSMKDNSRSSTFGETDDKENAEGKPGMSSSDFDLDAFVKQKLFLDPSELEVQLETPGHFDLNKPKASKSVWRRKTPTK